MAPARWEQEEGFYAIILFQFHLITSTPPHPYGTDTQDPGHASAHAGVRRCIQLDTRTILSGIEFFKFNKFASACADVRRCIQLENSVRD